MLAKVCEGNGECSAVESTPNTDYKTTCGDEIERVKMLNLGYLILDETQLIVLICQQIIEMELVKSSHFTFNSSKIKNSTSSILLTLVNQYHFITQRLRIPFFAKFVV
jgi:hypothetical protein